MTMAFSFAVLEVIGNTVAVVNSFVNELSVQIPKQHFGEWEIANVAN